MSTSPMQVFFRPGRFVACLLLGACVALAAAVVAAVTTEGAARSAVLIGGNAAVIFLARAAARRVVVSDRGVVVVGILRKRRYSWPQIHCFAHSPYRSISGKTVEGPVLKLESGNAVGLPFLTKFNPVMATTATAPDLISELEAWRERCRGVAATPPTLFGAPPAAD